MRARVEAVWPRACDAWSRWLRLGLPEDRPGLESIAAIHLGQRAVYLHEERIREAGLEHALEAILAHEVGHHVVAPRTVEVAARLRVMERCVLGDHAGHRVNLFTDLIVNQRLPRYSAQLAEVYRTLVPRGDVLEDPVLGLCLATYEELWGLPLGDLLGVERFALERGWPTLRRDAVRLAESLFLMGPNLFTQQLFFLSVVRPYERDRRDAVLGCLDDEPGDAETLGGVVRASAREREAVARAMAEGWLPDLEHAVCEERRLTAVGCGEWPSRGIVGRWYLHEAERYLRLPPVEAAQVDALTPLAPEDWEPGMSPARIDWSASLARGEVLGLVMPRVQAWEGDAPGELPSERVRRLEVYLDVSGSMPDPATGLNALTLAAVVLCAATARAAGEVRLVLFSNRVVSDSGWVRSSAALAEQAVGYQGGGTQVPFWVMRTSLLEHRSHQPVRVVISDGDFDAHLGRSAQGQEVVPRLAEHGLVLILHGEDDTARASHRRMGAQVLSVPELADIPRVAAAVAERVFDRG